MFAPLLFRKEVQFWQNASKFAYFNFKINNKKKETQNCIYNFATY